jgi:hypothetical protein
VRQLGGRQAHQQGGSRLPPGSSSAAPRSPATLCRLAPDRTEGQRKSLTQAQLVTPCAGLQLRVLDFLVTCARRPHGGLLGGRRRRPAWDRAREDASGWPGTAAAGCGSAPRERHRGTEPHGGRACAAERRAWRRRRPITQDDAPQSQRATHSEFLGSATFSHEPHEKTKNRIPECP